MKYRHLGKQGLRVSELALGSWMTDVSADDKQDLAAQSIQLAYEKGINFFDCADAYSGGAAERFLGKTLAQFPRKELVLSSKVFFPTGAGVNDRGLSRKHITESINQSLKNLQTDYLDLYFCHRFDPETPLAETLTTLSGLIDQGKILYYGVSEWRPVQILEAQLIIQERGLHPMAVAQPQYNMFDRYIEHELLDVCERLGLGVVPFSPLSQGLLTGKYRKGQAIPAGSRATYQDQIKALLTADNLDKVEELVKMAAELNTDLATFALAWGLRDQRISSLITGASKPQQLANNLKALDLDIPSEYFQRIDQLFGFKKFSRQIG
ncbi:aldo/keto reductase family protein [Levilactobacillus brevis]|uniref:aldo/keto reductase family protein n=1 Tax=Levilactobacillus brevis TaxID=1580 RepID=UPI00041B76B6|nr:aldo/keto reductase family protein [Levilactobacillus brevis]ATU70511.1 aldo/keto reductase [Levilactobacillus brevis]KID43664.1 voltage-gated potassium channel beta subunit [Levilactobacillus brevis]MBS0978757.1 aldo/keto reductase family protein [Levilactobacillus brevis]MCU0200838.1 aldo/keto reductase family protein [Levilactobacillus brevis]ORJ56249.1 aldo/keto reductase [Levilactobacillus brevis]